MAASAADTVWANSRASNGSLLVLLAIAHECGEEGVTEMRVAELAEKCRLSDRGVRLAVKDLCGLDEITVTPHPGGVSRYELSPRFSTTPADSAGPTPAEFTGPWSTTPADSAGPTPADIAGVPEEQQVTEGPANIAGVEISNVFSTTTGRSVVAVKDVPAKPPRDDERPDVSRLVDHLARRITENGSRPPRPNRKWRDAARLLIDKDGMTEEQVHAAIDWSQDHEFWRGVILSMPKLREQYDKLRQQARRKPNRPDGNENLGYVADFLKRNGVTEI